jgi:hypothetical protein
MKVRNAPRARPSKPKRMFDQLVIAALNRSAATSSQRTANSSAGMTMIPIVGITLASKTIAMPMTMMIRPIRI